MVTPRYGATGPVPVRERGGNRVETARWAVSLNGRRVTAGVAEGWATEEWRENGVAIPLDFDHTVKQGFNIGKRVNVVVGQDLNECRSPAVENAPDSDNSRCLIPDWRDIPSRISLSNDSFHPNQAMPL